MPITRRNVPDVSAMTDLHPELARQVLQAIPGPLAVLNGDNVIVWVNAEFASLAAREAADCLGLTVDDLGLPLRTVLGAEARRIVGPVFSGSVLVFAGGETGGAGAMGAGILTREAALQRLEAEISRSRRYENPLSCLVAQVPEQTDEAPYAALERMLREQLRWVDVLARWSDSELLVLLPETHARAAAALGRKLAGQAHAQLAPVKVRWGTSTWRRGDDARLFVTRALDRERSPIRALKLRARR